MSSVWGMILQRGNTIKVSLELPVATRHRLDMTEKLLKATLNPNNNKVQRSPFIMLCLGSVELDRVISEPCYKGIIL